MLNANVLNEAACYSNPATRKGVALNILYSSYRIFKSASRIQKINSLSALKPGKESIETVHKTLSALDSAVIDSTKIILCFENFFKAELLSYGYIVHIIDSRADGKKYKHLLKEQKEKPIKLGAIRAIEGLKYKKGNNYSFNSLKNKTLSFSEITKNETYKKTFRLEAKLFDILSSINSQRNNLHLMIGETDSFNETVISNYKYLINIVNKRIVTKHNKLCDDLDFDPRAKINAI